MAHKQSDVDYAPMVDGDLGHEYGGKPPRKASCSVRLGLALLAVAATVIVVLAITTGGSDEIPGSDEPAVTTDHLFHRHNLHAPYSDSAHCMDGTVPAYFTRKGSNNNWIIMLEYGTSFCWDQATCDTRASTARDHVTSSTLPDTKEMGGVLNYDSNVNSLFWDYNMISIPYCSSDYWTGNATPAQSGTTYYFQGAAIIKSVIEQELASGRMNAAETVAIWGQGAGGYGVLVQSDLITEYLAPLGDSVDIRGVMDSAWSANVEPFQELECTSAASCQTAKSVGLAVQTWNPVYPQRCINAGLTWECYIGSLSVLENAQTPLLAFQWQYEISQLASNGIRTIDEENQWFADEVATARLSEFNAISSSTLAYHYPNCNDHEIALMDWIELRGIIADTALTHSVYDWFAGATVRVADTCTEVNCNPTCGLA